MTERKASIFNIQKYNMYDGDGIRTIVFFKGCPLRCLWCSNPEGQSIRYQILFKKDLCVHCGQCSTACPTGVHDMIENKHIIVNPKACIGCGACAKICPKGALAVVGERKTISELLEIIEQDRIFYETSGGGVTLSGGEVLMQPEAALNLLMACKQAGINTAVETCGYAKLEVVQRAAEYVDTFLYDFKHADSKKHYTLTGVHNENILRNLKWLLENNCRVKIRIPLLNGVNNDEQNLRRMAEFLVPYKEQSKFMGIDLLPYHKFGVNKYTQLGWEYPLLEKAEISDEELEHAAAILRQYDLSVHIQKH